MADKSFLKTTDGIPGKVWIPFNPHFFHNVHSNIYLIERYDISYIRDHEIDGSTHKLAFSTQENDDFNVMKKDIREEDRHITTSRKEILNYGCGWMLSKESCEEIMEPLGNVLEVCYILLCLKPNKWNSSKTPFTDYSLTLEKYCNNLSNTM